MEQKINVCLSVCLLSRCQLPVKWPVHKILSPKFVHANKFSVTVAVLLAIIINMYNMK